MKNTSHMRAANDLARLRICAVLPEPSLIANCLYQLCDLGTYRLSEQQKTRRACTFAQSR